MYGALRHMINVNAYRFRVLNRKKYPHPSSFLSVRSKFGIISSRMSCFGRVCIRKKDFVERTRIFIKEFRARGYPLKDIHGFVGRFLRKKSLQFTMKGIMESLFKNVL